MKRSKATLAVVLCTGALSVLSTAAPAVAASSPPPRVRIGHLSEPTLMPDGREGYWLDLTAKDPDGVITEVHVELTGDNFGTVIFAHRSCFLMPSEPGDPAPMRIPLSLPGPGRYEARVHAESVTSCDNPSDPQSGPEAHRRFRVRA